MSAAPAHEIKDFVGHVKYDILEDDEKTGRMTVRGIFQRSNVQNANGRIYTTSLWEKTLQDPKVQESLQGRRMFGEVEHPKDGVTNLSRVSHIVTGLEKKGDEIIGEAMVLNTPAGQIVQELFRAGSEVGISSRGRGTSQMRGGVEYVDETSFQLDTFDFVFKPSTPGAYPKLVESVLHDSPYGEDSTMNDKLSELKRVEVRAMDIASGVGKTDISRAELGEWYTECVELDAAAESVLSNLTEDEAEEHKDQAEAATTKLAEAKGLVVASLDAFHESNDADLDRRVLNARAGIIEESGDDTSDTKDSTPKTEAQVGQLQVLVQELTESRDYYKDRLSEALDVLEADEADLTKRYLAAKKLGEELLSRLGESERALADITQEYEALEERYQAATQLVAGVVERQDRGRLLRMVREAIEMHPELQKFHKSLLACESTEELEQRLSEYAEALDLPTQDKEEAMVNQVNLSAALEGGDSVEEGEGDDEETAGEETPMGERFELPSAGDTINESEDSEVLSGADRSLLENHEDRGVSAAHRAVGKRTGWK